MQTHENEVTQQARIIHTPLKAEQYSDDWKHPALTSAKSRYRGRHWHRDAHETIAMPVGAGLPAKGREAAPEVGQTDAAVCAGRRT